MDTIKDFTSQHPYVVAGVVAMTTAYICHQKFSRKADDGIVAAPANTVVLYQIPRGPFAPSMSPFPIKLETYLRLAGIPYQNEFGMRMSPKQKFPFISYNGQIVSDSQFVIEFLNAEFNVDLNQGLSKEEKAVAHALRVMLDEHLYWCVAYFRWVYDSEQRINRFAFPWFVRRMIKKTVTEQLYGQGIGRHSVQEIKGVLLQDLQALEDQLGAKRFLLGDRPTEVDCSAFGMLAQLVYHSTDDVTEGLVQKHFPKLVDYCERIKASSWADWEDCITAGGTRSATK